MARYDDVPALRVNNTPDATDPERVRFVLDRWHSQDAVLRQYEIQVEENVRMLVGQQWWFFSERLGRFVNVEEFLSDDERMWRQRPVLNRILYWFLHTHARLTENPAIIGFLPGPDRIDAELAETMDIWYKTVWREADMTDAWDRLTTWLLPAGRAHFLSRIDWSKGELQPWTGEAALPILGPDGQPAAFGPDGQPLTATVPDVPHDRDGQPIVYLDTQGQLQPLPGAPQRPHATRAGQIVVDVLSPLEVRGAWGPKPWHERRWHARVVHLTADEIAETWGVEVSGKATMEGQGAQDTGMLDRLLFGAGYYGAAERRVGSGGQQTQRQGYYRVVEYWEKPCQFPGMEEGIDQPGGRYTVVCEDTQECLSDGPRPAAFPYTSPVSTFEFVRLPGRSNGTSIQEYLNSPNRSGNRLFGHKLEHAALTAHPIGLKARGTGLEHISVTNKPGQIYEYTPIPNVEPLKYVAAPQLSSDLDDTVRSLFDFMVELGGTQAAPGEPPTRDASGELVKELRFDRDRWVGPTQRRSVEEMGRLVETWQALAPLLFTTERLIQYTGEDNVARTVVVQPYLFQQGKVNVVPDPESMLPEGRGERQQRVSWMYQNGLFGPPGTPEAINRFFELVRFPHLSRAAKPGGADRTTAEQNLGAILMGEQALNIPLYPWYDLTVHLYVYENFMKSPEFKRQSPEVQNELATLWQQVKEFMMVLAPPPMPVEAGGGGPGEGPPPESRSLRASGPVSADEVPNRLQETSV